MMSPSKGFTDVPSDTFGTRMKAARKRLGLTQNAAAELLEIPARTYWEWEHDATTPMAICQEGALARFAAAEAGKRAVPTVRKREDTSSDPDQRGSTTPACEICGEPMGDAEWEGTRPVHASCLG